MILHAIEFNHVGRFRSPVRIGPFGPGLNILAAPNEAGKSTSIRAAARALFDRHTGKTDEIKSLQPAGTSLAPQIAVEFETAQGRFRIEKTFLQSARSVLKKWQGNSWQPIAEEDAATQQVHQLLQSTLPARGASKPENWGFFNFLWARQDEPAAWPDLDGDATGQRIRNRLAKVELDPLLDKLCAKLGAASDQILTASGGAKTNGPLANATNDLATLETSLAELRQTFTKLAEAHQRFTQAETVITRLEAELSGARDHARTLQDKARECERLAAELNGHTLALAAAQEKLALVSADEAAHTAGQNELAALKAAVAQAEAEVSSQGQKLAAKQAEIDQAQALQPEQEQQLQTRRDRRDRVQSLLKLRALTTEAETLARRLEKVEKAGDEVKKLEDLRKDFPSVVPAKLKALETQAETVRTLQAQLQALGLTVDLTPDGNRAATVLTGATTGRFELTEPGGKRILAPQSLELHLEGWGRVSIRSGAQEAQNTANKLKEAETAQRLALEEAGFPSAETAREALVARRDLEARIQNAQSSLAHLLGEDGTLAQLREAAQAAARKAGTLASSLAPTDAEKVSPRTDLETSESELTAQVTSAEKALKAGAKRLENLRQEERAAAKAAQEAAQLASDQRTRLRSLEARLLAMAERHPAGLAQAKAEAQQLFVQAEARVTMTKTALPADFEKLPARSRVAAAAVQQTEDDLKSARATRDEAKGMLNSLGGQGLYSRETELEERKVEATLRRDAAHAQGWTTRLARDLIERRRQAATASALAPLQERLTLAFGEISEDRTREVFLDEKLNISGLGTSRAEVYPFENLSQGAKEQLLLCLRIAVAQELAVDEPQVLILDDVLVNTDPDRQRRILEVLGALSARLQIVILTCHADRYRGLGTTLKLVSSS